ncbi:MAG: hypothetical protein H6Q14_322 [Bacteroidetes bacterium]|nr:hypothetical protein [Bacteroidota bacterium]
MTKKLTFLFAILFSFFCGVTKSQAIKLSDSADISILTNSPWTGAVYGLFGHASIRVKDPVRHLDFVFNYGMFSFQKPNFIYHFAKGETDYMVVPIPYAEFIVEYQEKGLEVNEQVIRLSSKDKQKVWDALCMNVLPENREYRYNFFFDNCATRPFDIIEKNISGKIVLPDGKNNPTFRNLLNEFLEGNDWTQFGINLVIGASADHPVTEKEKIFLPKYLHEILSKSAIRDSMGIEQPLVKSENRLNNKEDQPRESSLWPPWLAGLLLFLIASILSYWQWQTGRSSSLTKLFDFMLFAISGAAGVVMTFLMFFSVHPCMFPNWNYVWLHPLHLFAACLFYVKRCTKFIYYYHFINFALLTVFLLAWKLIPQELEWSFLPFVGTLWLRSLIGAFAVPKK